MRILFTHMYYKKDNNTVSNFFQAVYDDAILYAAFLYSCANRKHGYLISCCRNEKKQCVRKIIYDCVEASTRKSQARFQIIQVKCSTEHRMRLK